jgi:uncharacterized repeat protein (TIGR01451 family)
MNTKRLSIGVVLAGICVAGLLLLALWLVSAPPASTADAFIFYSPIPPVGDPQISLVKTIDDNDPLPGHEIEYTVSYANTNPGSEAYNVRLYDFLPAGLQFLSSDPDPDSFQDGMLLFSAPSIGPTTDSVQIRVRGRVREGYSRLENHALIVADGVIPVHASLLTEVAQPPSQLSLVKTGYSAVLVNDELVYTLICRNIGDATANEVTLIDVLPSGLPLVGVSPSPDEMTLPVLRWSLGSLAPGERRTVVITTTAPASAGVITNTAMLDSRQHVVIQTVFATQVVDQGAILRVTKLGSAPTVNPGDELVYTLRYRNAGDQLATGVILSDTFPADITVNAVHPPAVILTDQQGVWTLGTIAPGFSGQVVISTTVGGEGGRTLLNIADITGQPGSFPGHAELETGVESFWLYLPLVLSRH